MKITGIRVSKTPLPNVDGFYARGGEITSDVPGLRVTADIASIGAPVAEWAL